MGASGSSQQLPRYEDGKLLFHRLCLTGSRPRLDQRMTGEANQEDATIGN
jgi:hypothetical protein